MAQTIDELQNEIIAAKEADPNLSALTSTSKVSIWRLWTYVFAVGSWNLQKKQDAHKAEVAEMIKGGKAHKPEWYAAMAMKYRHGKSLIPDTDTYDDTGLTDADIEALQVVKYAAAQEVRKGVRIKFATLVGDDYAPLPTAQYNGAIAYMQRIKDAGVFIYGVNQDADSLKLNYTIYYDPLVLDANGARLDGGAVTPVKDAINNYLKSIKLNDLVVMSKQTAAIEAVDGVVIAKLNSAQYQYGALPYMDIDVEFRPDAGYARIINPTDLVLTYLPHANI